MTRFVNGEMDQFDFDLDYSCYMIDHFPDFQQEHPRVARQFCDTIDMAYELGEHLSGDELRDSMAHALDDFFGNR